MSTYNLDYVFDFLESNKLTKGNKTKLDNLSKTNFDQNTLEIALSLVKSIKKNSIQKEICLTQVQLKMHKLSPERAVEDTLTDADYTKLSKEDLNQYLIALRGLVSVAVTSNTSLLNLLSLPISLRFSPQNTVCFLKAYPKLVPKWKSLQTTNRAKFEGSKMAEYFPNLIDYCLSALNDQLIDSFLELIAVCLSAHTTRRTVLFYLREVLFQEKMAGLRVSTRTAEILAYIDYQFKNIFEIGLSEAEIAEKKLELVNDHFTLIDKFQSLCFTNFPEKLKKVYSKSISGIDSPENLREISKLLSEDELTHLISKLNLCDPSQLTSLSLKEEVLVRRLSRLEEPSSVSSKTVFPFSLAQFLPSLGYQYLNLTDMIYRQFSLFSYQFAVETGYFIEQVTARMQPKFDKRGAFLEFEGWQKDSVPCDSFMMVSVGEKRVGKEYPSSIKGEIRLNLKGVEADIVKEWDSLRPGDCLFLVNLNKSEESEISCVRGVTVESVFDEGNKEVWKEGKIEGNTRRIIFDFDPVQYNEDKVEEDFSQELEYGGFNMAVKAKNEEWLKVLSLLAEECKIPCWLEKSVLGYETKNLDCAESLEEKKRMTLIEGEFKSGKTETVAKLMLDQFKSDSEHLLLVTKNNQSCERIGQYLVDNGVDRSLVVKVGRKGTFKVDSQIEYLKNIREKALERVLKAATAAGITSHLEYSCETALNLFDKLNTNSELKNKFEQQFETQEAFEILVGDVKSTRILELIREPQHRQNAYISKNTRVIMLSASDLLKNYAYLKELNIKFSSVFFDNAFQLLEIHTLTALSLANTASRCVLAGDKTTKSTKISLTRLKTENNLDSSLFGRLKALGCPTITLPQEPEKVEITPVSLDSESNTLKDGLVNVEAAEYATAIFMYLRLTNTPEIAVLSDSLAQVRLLREVIAKKVGWNELIGMPSRVTTIQKNQEKAANTAIVCLLSDSPVPTFAATERVILLRQDGGSNRFTAVIDGSTVQAESFAQLYMLNQEIASTVMTD